MNSGSTSSRSNWAPWLFLAPFLLIFGTFTLWPLGQSLRLAFQQSYGPHHAVYVGWSNFRFLVHDPVFWHALRNTALYSAGSVCLQLPLALGLALLLNRPGLKGRTFLRLIFFAPSLVGLVFVAMIFELLFQKRTGLINSGLHALLPSWDPEFAWTDNHVMASLIVASMWLYAGFNMVYFLAALQNVNRELLDAASIDGAGPWARFRHVVLPEIRPVAAFIFLLAIVGSFQVFELPWVLLHSGSGPADRGLTVVMYLYQTGFLTGDLGYASAIGWVLGLFLAAAAAIQMYFSRKGDR